MPNNAFVLRGVVSLLACVSLGAAALAAPLTHLHDDASHASDHHNGRIIHAHYTPHWRAAHRSPSAPLAIAGSDDEQDVRAIDTYRMVERASVSAAALPSAVFAPNHADPCGRVIRPIVRHGHDPPCRFACSLRGPPR